MERLSAGDTGESASGSTKPTGRSRDGADSRHSRSRWDGGHPGDSGNLSPRRGAEPNSQGQDGDEP